MKNMPIVDSDVHIHESAKALAEYCESPWNRSLEVAKGIKERYLDVPGLSPGGAGFDPLWPSTQKRRMMVHSAPQLRKDLDSLGIEVAVLFPDHLLKLALFPNPDYAMALARAYNKWITRKWMGKAKGLYGAICVAPQDPEGSAEEIRRYGGKDHMTCAYLPTAGLPILYGDRRYDPVFEAAEKVGIPVALHSVTVVHPVFPFQLEQFPNVIGHHAISHPIAMAANAIHMISTGVQVRYPRLKICYTEGAISWVPWVMMRLDREYFEYRRQVPFLKERPSHYLKMAYYGTQPIEEPEKTGDYLKLLELIGNFDSVVFASDWPHHDFDHPRKLLGYPMPDEVKRKIMSENARALFNIGEV
jgi:uncharacterized protein